ncbi:hypothetical protein [Undibacter mobilis]|uniref:Uncharacterized protein n=1 Tax=Undibacter mobilis TaxID=2292256 RepID=A0A371B3X7_9BRAD|nr:hypothetical protein [Undibacter mobilis]RDV02153.1 hypothetical protein DXH78_16280 [Undibacter mobilis]
MLKEGFFDEHWGAGWPNLREIEACMLDPVRREAYFKAGRDGGSFFAKGLHGTEGLTPESGRISSALYLSLSPGLGASLQYNRWDVRQQKLLVFVSRGDLSRLGEFVRSFHGTPLSVGLFISFEDGFRAVKEFIETEGEQPTSIEWIDAETLPPETFPDP